MFQYIKFQLLNVGFSEAKSLRAIRACSSLSIPAESILLHF